MTEGNICVTEDVHYIVHYSYCHQDLSFWQVFSDDCHLLRCNTMQFSRQVPTFQGKQVKCKISSKTHVSRHAKCHLLLSNLTKTGIGWQILVELPKNKTQEYLFWGSNRHSAKMRKHLTIHYFIYDLYDIYKL